MDEYQDCEVSWAEERRYGRSDSDIGKIYVRLISTQAIRPDCVYMQPGYGHLSKGLPRPMVSAPVLRTCTLPTPIRSAAARRSARHS